ncbi:hypothetical protein DB88DRAFT_471298 [Papiliotrema laurentii]|uniref:Uncharacterized protein n=1 Tax=Papiliotrema laurentii TaxID=5418 RepID=A0AAD9L842_PAPLA|nr:hypothetical protein DB88DRAFT_471298 [Papiliotrema laurentii]
MAEAARVVTVVFSATLQTPITESLFPFEMVGLESPPPPLPGSKSPKSGVEFFIPLLSSRLSTSTNPTRKSLHLKSALQINKPQSDSAAGSAATHPLLRRPPSTPTRAQVRTQSSPRSLSRLVGPHPESPTNRLTPRSSSSVPPRPF